MNLAKVALYLEYIAFCLRREYAPDTLPPLERDPMTKTVNTLDSAEKVAAPNGKTEAPKKSGRKLSSELEAMHRIDKILEALPGAEGARVVQWLLSKYAAGQQTFDPNT